MLRRVPATLALAIALLCPRPLAAQVQQIRVVVHNRAQLTDELLRDAERVTSQIFRAAAVDIVWFHVTPEFRLPSGKTPVIRAIIVPRADTTIMNPPGDALGFTPSRQGQGSGLTYILEERLATVAQRLTVRKSVVLGVAIAHEIGHVLLPTRGHSASGVMAKHFDQPQFRAATRGELMFAPAETTGLRARIEELSALNR